MEGDDGAVEKELAGTVGHNGWINDWLPGTHAFPRSRRPTPLDPSWNGCSTKSPEKTCETQCEARNSALGARRPAGGKVVNARGSLWFGGELPQHRAPLVLLIVN